MFSCEARFVNFTDQDKNRRFVQFYISKAYSPNQVFVYKDVKGKVYLENLSTRIKGIEDEDFGFEIDEVQI